MERVSTILRALKKNSHHGFPVVNTGSNHRQRSFRGLILRKHLCMILKHRAFFESKPIAYETRPSLGEDDFESVYPRYPAIDDISLPSRFLNYWVDLTPYMNPAPYVIQEHSPVSHTFSIFRTMGLRHLCVVNKMNELVGMITRKDLTDFVLRRQVHDLLNPAPDSPVSSRASSSTVYSFVKNLDLIKKSPSSSENLKLLPSSSENI